MRDFLILFLLFLNLFSCESTSKRFPISDHYDGKRFNNIPVTKDKGLLDVLKWKFTTSEKKWPKKVENETFMLPIVKNNEVVITWINHATFLIQSKGLNILTDPVYSERVSPFSFVGPKRVRKPGLKFDDLPRVDLIIISHNHYDHLDLEALKRLHKKFSPIFLVPLGDKELLEKNEITNVFEMDWSDQKKIKDDVITFLPAKHWSARWITDKRESLWGSYMLKLGDKMIYFGGDTGYSAHFKIIAEKFPTIDLSLLPVGAYEPRWFMRAHHMNSEDSVMAHIDLKSSKSIGMHFGTFQLTNEGIDDPVDDLVKAIKKYKISNNSFFVLPVGSSYILN